MTSRAATSTSDIERDPVLIAAPPVLLARIAPAVLTTAPILFDPFDLSKSAASHVLSAALAVLLLWSWLRHGRELFPWSPMHAALGALLAAFCVSTLFAVDQQVALFGA